MIQKMTFTILVFFIATTTYFVNAQKYIMDINRPGMIYVYPCLLNENLNDTLPMLNINSNMYSHNILNINRSIFRNEFEQKNNFVIKKWDNDNLDRYNKYIKSIIYIENYQDDSLIIAI